MTKIKAILTKSFEITTNKDNPKEMVSFDKKTKIIHTEGFGNIINKIADELIKNIAVWGNCRIDIKKIEVL